MFGVDLGSHPLARFAFHRQLAVVYLHAFLAAGIGRELDH